MSDRTQDSTRGEAARRAAAALLVQHCAVLGQQAQAPPLLIDLILAVPQAHEPPLPHLGLDLWSPNINLNRDPRWGRNMEVPSEDPLVLARFGVAYTRGVQSGEDAARFAKAASTIKHFLAYSFEGRLGAVTRHSFDAVVSPYDLMESYLPAFRASVVEGPREGDDVAKLGAQRGGAEIDKGGAAAVVLGGGVERYGEGYVGVVLVRGQRALREGVVAHDEGV